MYRGKGGVVQRFGWETNGKEINGEI